MKFLFILLLPFLVSINSISKKNSLLVESNEVKACGFEPNVKDEYLKGNYKYIKRMNLNMYAERKKDTAQYTLILEEGDNIKFITHLRNKNIDNLLVVLQDSRRRVIQDKTLKIDENRNELKAIIPQKGIYYLSFIRNDSTNQEIICGSSLFFIKN